MLRHEGGAQEEHSPPPVEEGAPLWTVTFGDMMSLLLTFFILLFSMSELRMERFLLASQSLNAAFGGAAPESIGPLPDSLPGALAPASSFGAEGDILVGGDSSDDGESRPGSGPGRPVAEVLAEEYLDQVARRLEAFVREHGIEEHLGVSTDPSGVRIMVLASALFEPGLATVSDESRWLIDFLADLAREVPVPVVVSGHADNQPIQSDRFASNWELSAARAAGIARELVDRGHDPQLLRVESFGEHRPVASNDSEDGRASNRRIEFLYDRRDVLETIERWRMSLTDSPPPAASP